MREQVLYAFWKNDRFPYLLWGQIDSFTKHGLVIVPSYAMNFRPLLILPESSAKELIRNLELLTKDYNEQLEELKKIALESADSYVEEYGIKISTLYNFKRTE